MWIQQLEIITNLEGHKTTLRCKQCGFEGDEKNFYPDKKSKTGRRTICKKCHIKNVGNRAKTKSSEIKIYHHNYYLKNKDKTVLAKDEYKDFIFSLKRSCLKCGESRLCSIDFHHVNPEEKSFNINRRSVKKDRELVRKEAKKCISLCRNCHAEFHYLYKAKPDKPIESLIEYLGFDFREQKEEKKNETV